MKNVEGSPGVFCGQCNNKVMPRLWHGNHDSLVWRRHTEHICPVCGDTLYVTGGGATLLGLVVMPLFAAFALGLFVKEFVGTAASDISFFSIWGGLTAHLALRRWTGTGIFGWLSARKD